MMAETIAPAKTDVLCRISYRRLRASVSLPALSETIAGLRAASILGGNEAKIEADRFSYWAAEPREVFELYSGQADPFGKLESALGKYRTERRDNRELPKNIFCCGWIGYFGYELARYIERLPKTTLDDLGMPLIRLCFYDRVIAYDHVERVFWLIALELPNDSEEPNEKLADLEQLLDKSKGAVVSPLSAADLDNIDISKIRRNMGRDYYFRAVEKIKRYIYDGEVYQVNFSQRFECDYEGSAIQLYHWQNRHNPSPYAAYMDAGNFRIISASPEMFISVHNGYVKTKPIKGTRRRMCESGRKDQQSKLANARSFSELLTSEKERAELNMIIDLERNDVAKICEPGTRRVIQPRTIEAYPTVFHAVATVAGRLRANITLGDILKAMFPGGSITGAPKIRSMQIIDETEPTARGVYTGSMGYVGTDGNVCLNIAIRTIIIAGRKAFVQTGGGIVADSDAEAEWQETITKARAPLAGIEVTRAKSAGIRGYASAARY